MPLGTFGGHLRFGTPEKVDFASVWVSFWIAFGDSVGTLFLLRAPPAPFVRALEHHVSLIWADPGVGLVLIHPLYTQFVDFCVSKFG